MAAGLLKRLGWGSLQATMLKGCGALLLFLMHTQLGRCLGPQDYGLVSLALACGTLIGTLSSLGLPKSCMRFVSEYVEKKDWACLKGFLIRSPQIIFGVTAASALLLIYCSPILPIPSSYREALKYAAWLLPLLAFSEWRGKCLRGLGLIGRALMPDEVFFPLLMVVALFLWNPHQVFLVVLVYASALMTATVVSLGWIWQHLPSESKTATPRFETVLWLRTSWPMIVGTLTHIVITRADALILGYMVDLESLGVYSAASRLAILVDFPLMGIAVVSGPMIAAAFYGNRFADLRKILVTSMVIPGLLAVPLLSLLLWHPEWLLNFFGTSFDAGKNVLRILAVGQFVNCATGVVGFALLMTGFELAYARTMVVTSIITIVANLIMIQIAGVIGAALATAGATAMYNLWQLWIVLTKVLSPHNRNET